MLLRYIILLYLGLTSPTGNGRDGYHLRSDSQADARRLQEEKEKEYADRRIQEHIDEMRRQDQEREAAEKLAEEINLCKVFYFMKIPLCSTFFLL